MRYAPGMTRATLIILASLALAPQTTEAQAPVKICYKLDGEGLTPVPCPRKAPNQCDATEHCDDKGCWCGPPDAKENPRPDHTGLPLVAREAVASGWECKVTEGASVTVGDCTVASWTCDRSWCRDSAGHSWAK